MRTIDVLFGKYVKEGRTYRNEGILFWKLKKIDLKEYTEKNIIDGERVVGVTGDCRS